jgi:hypothetical protein
MYPAQSEFAVQAVAMALPFVVSHAAPLAVYLVRQVSHACVLTVGAALQ